MRVDVFARDRDRRALTFFSSAPIRARAARRECVCTSSSSACEIDQRDSISFLLL